MTKSAQDLIKLSTGVNGIELSGSTSQSLQLILEVLLWACHSARLNVSEPGFALNFV